MLESLFDSLLEQVKEVRCSGDGDKFLKLVKSSYGLTNVAYLGINIPQATHGQHYVQCTYSSDWIRHYVDQSFVDIDPVVRCGLTQCLPLDWANLQRREPAAKQLFDDAKESGIGHQGLTFPIRGMHGETAIFSINSDASDRDWQNVKRICMRDLQVIANFFHNCIIEAAGHDIYRALPTLSNRELECLKWCADGKTAFDTSVILNLSERTVRFHLATARHKLNCLTTTQAVAKAIAFGIMPPFSLGVWPVGSDR